MPLLRSAVTEPKPTEEAVRAERAPKRTCVGCRAALEKRAGVRLVSAPDDSVVADLAGKSFGRGAWVHPTPECIARAVRSGLTRSFRRAVTWTVSDINFAIRFAADRKLGSLLLAARRSGQIVAGADATEESWQRGEVAVLVLAPDAGRIATAGWVQEAVVAGRAVVWGNKEKLGQLCGKAETAVLGVRGHSFAEPIQSTAVLTALADAQGSAPVALVSMEAK